MKVATILYHKNISSIYKYEWIQKCVDSIKEQTFKDFIIYEINYGDDDLNLSKKYNINQNHYYYKVKLNNHAEAMNFLFDKCLEDGVDIIINNNLDDYSNPKRFETQIRKIEEGYDLVSSNFTHIDIDDKEIRNMMFSKLNIKDEFNKGHNIICHPSVCYSINFIKNNRYNPSEIPEEDFNLWKRTIDEYKFYICEEFLLNYRIHKNQITESGRDKSLKVKNNHINKNNIIPEFNIMVKPGLIRCSCGEPKDKVRYNFCQKCNKLY